MRNDGDECDRAKKGHGSRGGEDFSGMDHNRDDEDETKVVEEEEGGEGEERSFTLTNSNVIR